MKLLLFLRKYYSHLTSVKGLKRAIDIKGCRINGQIERISTRPLKTGDLVELELPQKSEKPQILYEDEEVRIYNKPAGVVSEAKNFRGKLVHRLDKETSGVLIVAKSEKARGKIVEFFSQKKVKKEYLAIVDGKMDKKEGTVQSRLVKKRTSFSQLYVHSGLTGKEAITHWKCLSTGKNSSLLLCEPITGRTHQIRVHLKEIGHPILGDFQYGKKSTSFRRHLLHAWKIRFGEIEVTAPIPQDFLETLHLFHLYWSQ